MASSSKPTPRQTFTKIKSPHLLESSFDVMDKSVSRPNSSMATPTYMSTVQYKSTQSTLKRTRSNSSIPTEGPRPVNTSEKSTGSPVNFQLSVHGISPKGISDLSATTSLQLDKGTSDDSYMKSRNKNSSGNRMLSSNGWAGQKKFKASHQLLEHSQSEFQRHKSPMHSRESKRNDSVSKRDMGDQNKSQVKELILGYSKSVSYGIAESETPGSTQRTAGLTKRNKFQTPVFTIDCDMDLKENKEGLQENMNRNNIETPHIQSPYTIMPLEKSNQNTLAKKTARGSSVKRSNQGLDEKKSEKRGKENELVDESQLRERGSNNKAPNRNSSFFNKKTDLRPPSRPSTTKASLSTRREEPVNFSELSTRQLETPTDLEASARILQKIRPPMMLHAHSATVTPKNYFVPKTTSSVSQSQRNSSPRSSKTPRTTFNQLQTQPANAEILTSVQPSKNSEFSFKMTYFKPIEDSKLDEFIRDVNDSYFPKKDLNKTSEKPSEKNRHVTEPMEPSFSTPLPSTGATSKARSRYSGDNSKDEGLNSTGEVTIPETKVLGSSKKSLTIESKNTSTLMEKTMVQEMHGKPPKPRSNNSTIKLKEERQTTTECVPERAVSPSFESKKNMMSAEKSKVKDMSSTTKIESKARTTYSKLDKLLQEIKSNPGNKQSDEEGKPDSSELEKELFGQSSKGISSSSSTNCSISKSYAHTLMKVTSV